MEPNSQTSSQKYTPLIIVLLVLLAGTFVYLYIDTRNKLQKTSEEYFNTRTELEGTVANLQNELAIAESQNRGLQTALNIEKGRNDEFADTIQEIAGTVGVLEKLSKTDEELLQKYSKVYFLNEHYVPANLSQINPDNLYDESQDQYIHTQVLPLLENMIRDAAQEDITLYIRSAYRSFGTQTALKSNYKVTYGEGANTFSADQGFSEHQLGTAVDFTTTGINGALDGFDKTKAYDWLLDNAHKYGFTLSYPEGNAYYVFEPWHWRFVGKDLATFLFEEKKHFYDLDQRTIDTYLVDIFE